MVNILLSIPYIVWLVLSAICFAIGEYFSKKFGLSPSYVLVACILASYIVGTLFWLPAIVQNNQLSIVGAIWSVMSLMATVLIGVLIFGEQLNALSLAGIFLGAIAIFLLSIA
jgi:multidrug transporter EmrE-like cation transporter